MIWVFAHQFSIEDVRTVLLIGLYLVGCRATISMSCKWHWIRGCLCCMVPRNPPEGRLGIASVKP